MGRYAARLFALDQGVNGQLRMAQTGFVLALREVSTQNVVPGGHLIAAIDGHRHHRRVRKNKTHRTHAGQIELLGNGKEIAAISTQAVQYQHCGNRVFAGLGF